jgi:hypothetical protein
MVLFFIVALVAAYTSRNLIFEQRTSANQYRSTQAFEAAEAGIEWALAMLNGGRIDDKCVAHTSASTTEDSFRQRYLTIPETADPIVPRPRSNGDPLRAGCVFDGNDGKTWACSCPTDGEPSLTGPTGPGPHPAFVVRFFANSPAYPPGSPDYPPGVVRIESTGCTRFDASNVCASAAEAGDGRATVTILAALKSALATPPSAAVTARGAIGRIGDTELTAVNTDEASGGFTQHAAGNALAPDAKVHLLGAPGTPAENSVIENDAAMAGLSAARMYSSVFAMERATYRQQPAAVIAPCGTECDGAAIRDLARLNPGRPIWIGGGLSLDVADPVGTPDAPVVLIVEGDVDITVANARINGVVYQTGNRWDSSVASTLAGALIGEGALDFGGDGTPTVAYDAQILERLRRTSGSFVRIPGSWRDF